MVLSSPRSEVGTSVSAVEIARVAARLFASRGYDATSVREIVEAAGVTKPTLYYHFGSKEGLAQALLTDPLTALVERMRSILGGPLDPVARLAAIFEEKFAFTREEPDRSRFLFAVVMGPHGAGPAEELCRFGDALDTLEIEGVRGLAAAGVVPAEKVEDCAFAFRGLACARIMEFLYRDGTLASGLGAQLVDDVLRGFARPGALDREEAAG